MESLSSWISHTIKTPELWKTNSTNPCSIVQHKHLEERRKAKFSCNTLRSQIKSYSLYSGKMVLQFQVSLLEMLDIWLLRTYKPLTVQRRQPKMPTFKSSYIHMTSYWNVEYVRNHKKNTNKEWVTLKAISIGNREWKCTILCCEFWQAWMKT